jgi:hypothetical protein
LPAASKGRITGDRIKCLNNLKQLGLALHSYHDVVGHFPSGGSNTFPSADLPYIQFNLNGGSAGSWPLQILPYIEQMALYNSGPLIGSNADYTNRIVPIFFCPTRRIPTNLSNGYAPFDYLGNGQGSSPIWNTPNGVFRATFNAVNPPIAMANIVGGTSNKIGIGEKNLCLALLNTGDDVCDNKGQAWGCDYGESGNYDNTVFSNQGTQSLNGHPLYPDLMRTSGCNQGNHSYGSSHPVGANFFMMDGSVRMIVFSEGTNTIVANNMNLIQILNNISLENVLPND